MEPPLLADDFSGAGEGGAVAAERGAATGAGRVAGPDVSLIGGTSAGGSGGERNFFLKKLNIE
jgi:hypothetical protein